nr:MAG TPA: hypothetical protein [Caudoviricetes sp.]
MKNHKKHLTIYAIEYIIKVKSIQTHNFKE